VNQKNSIICLFLIIGVWGICSVSGATANPYQAMNNPYQQVDTGVTGVSATSLQEIANGYTPQSRIGWKIAINGIDAKQGSSKMEFGSGQITGYDSSSGTLTGEGQIYQTSPGSTSSASPDITSLGSATVRIHVNDNSVDLSTSGSNPGQGTAWAQNLGTYSNLQEGGESMFYGFGNNPDYSDSMCILTLTSFQVPLGSVPQGDNLATPKRSYSQSTGVILAPTPTLVSIKTRGLPPASSGLE
jgi:hypothetical protein